VDVGEQIAIAAGCAFGIGLLVVIVGLVGSGDPVPKAAKPVSDSLGDRFLNFLVPATGPHTRQKRQALAIGVPIVAVGVHLVTKVPVFAITAAVLLALLPSLVLPDRSRKMKLEQLRALDAWIRGLSARMRSGISLDQALSSSARDVDAIGPELRRMAAAIAAGIPTRVAVRGFAEEMGDGTYDFACQKLILVSGRSVDGLSDALESLAEAVSKRVAARQEIEIDRAKPQSTARLVVIFGLAMMIGFPLVERDFMTPYRTFTGQIAFGFLMALCVLCLLWAKSMARMEPEPRIFGPEAAMAPDEEKELFGLGRRG
jgi:Flp pilus assembly protein TadB